MNRRGAPGRQSGSNTAIDEARTIRTLFTSAMRRGALPLVLLAIALVGSACGSDDGTTVSIPDGDPVPARTSTNDSVGGDDDAEEAAPTAQARATGRRLDALVLAYAPVSSRVNFVVTAETLRSDAETSGVDEDVELERAGTVRVESERMLAVLAAVRPNVVDATVASRPERLVQARMIAAIDARARAMRRLQRTLTARGAAEPVDSVVEVLQERWRADWDVSMRAAREATTIMQDARAELGLDPAAEEAIR